MKAWFRKYKSLLIQVIRWFLCVAVVAIVLRFLWPGQRPPGPEKAFLLFTFSVAVWMALNFWHRKRILDAFAPWFDDASYPRVPFNGEGYRDVHPAEFIERVMKGKPWIILVTVNDGQRLHGSFTFYFFDSPLSPRLTKPLIARSKPWKRNASQLLCKLLRTLRGQGRSSVGFKTSVPFTGERTNKPRTIFLEGTEGQDFQYLIWACVWNMAQTCAPVYRPSTLLEKGRKNKYAPHSLEINNTVVEVGFY